LFAVFSSQYGRTKVSKHGDSFSASSSQLLTIKKTKNMKKLWKQNKTLVMLAGAVLVALGLKKGWFQPIADKLGITLPTF
jgi:hypothetical protein